LNTKSTSMIHLLYHRIYFTASQWSLPRSFMHLLNIETTCDKSSPVHTIEYIKLPTVLAYGTWDLYSQSSTDFGDIVALSLKWGANGVQTDSISPFILNFEEPFANNPFESNSPIHYSDLFLFPWQVPSLHHRDPSSQIQKTIAFSIYRSWIYSLK